MYSYLRDATLGLGEWHPGFFASQTFFVGALLFRGVAHSTASPLSWSGEVRYLSLRNVRVARSSISQFVVCASRSRAAPGSQFVVVLGAGCVSRSVALQIHAARCSSGVISGMISVVAITIQHLARRPNLSVKPTRNIRPRWPRGTHGYVAPRGHLGLPSRAAYLERWTAQANHFA